MNLDSLVMIVQDLPAPMTVLEMECASIGSASVILVSLDQIAPRLNAQKCATGVEPV